MALDDLDGATDGGLPSIDDLDAEELPDRTDISAEEFEGTIAPEEVKCTNCGHFETCGIYKAIAPLLQEWAEKIAESMQAADPSADPDADDGDGGDVDLSQLPDDFEPPIHPIELAVICSQFTHRNPPDDWGGDDGS